MSGIFLGNCRLASWASVDALNCFPGLVETRLTGNPVVEAMAHSRYEIVARVRTLRILNGSIIGTSERRDSELRYLRRVLTEQQTEGDPADERAAGRAAAAPPAAELHPRLQQLMEAHGDVAGPAAARGPASSKLVSDMLSLTLRCPTSAKAVSAEKKLPKSTTIGKLKVLCEKLFGVRVTGMSVSICRAGVELPEPAADDRQDLYLLGLVSGDAILIEG